MSQRSNDKFRCVLLVLCGTLTAFLVDGFLCSLTLIKPYWESDHVASSFALDWILSCMVGGCFLFSPFVTFLTTKIGTRATIIIGGYLTALSVLTASFFPNYWCLLAILGVITTISLAMQMVTSIICISMNFEEKRPTAMGIMTCGTGLGITFYSLITPSLAAKYSWQQILVFLACINLHVCLLGVLMKSRESILEFAEQGTTGPKTSINSQPETDADKSSYNVNTLANIIKSTALIPGIFIGSTADSYSSRIDLTRVTVPDLMRFEQQVNKQKLKVDLNQMMGTIGSMIYINKLDEYMSGIPRQEKARSLAKKLLDEPIYFLILLGSLAYALAFQAPTTYLVSIMKNFNYSDMQIGQLFMAYGLFNSCCRVCIGLFAATKYCNVIYVITITLLDLAIFTFSVPWMKQLYQFYIFAFGFAFGQASCTVLLPLTIAKVMPVKDLADSMSKQLFIMGIGLLIGMPITGFILEYTNYYVAYSYSSAMMLMSVLCFLVASIKYYARDDQKRMRKALEAQVHGIDTSEL